MKNKLVTIGLIFLAIAFCVYIWNSTEVNTDKKSKGAAQLVSTDSLHAKGDSVKKDSAVLIVDTVKTDSVLVPAAQVHTKNVYPQQVVDFSKTLIGTPYRYASTDPKVGFDCSGFITYVFNHFNIIVPRSSIDFTNVGKEISTDAAKPGDLILFTGTDSTEKARIRWARVKGKTENDLLKLPFHRVYNFRPGFIKPIAGLKRINPYYKYINWLFPIGRSLYSKGFCTLTELALAMINIVYLDEPSHSVEGKEIISLGSTGKP